MIRSQLIETTGFAQQILRALVRLFPGAPTVASARLQMNCGYVYANAANQLDTEPGTPFFANLSACFNAALVAGATYQQFDAVRVLALGFAPQSAPAIAVCNFTIRMALIAQSRWLTAQSFTSRQAIDAYITRVQDAFEPAEITAADSMDNVSYVNLITLKAAVIANLSNTARTLPAMISLRYPTRFPALYLAQRIYQDGSQGDALVAENLPVHPLFMPTEIVALSPGR
jgi:prophage DNA circulation protein